MRKSKYIGHKNSRGAEVISSFSRINNNRYKTYFKVRCTCGNIFEVLPQHLLSEAIVSCGCVRTAQNLNLTGQTINNLVVQQMLPPTLSDSHKKQRCLVACKCGKTFTCIATELKRKRILSCGCRHTQSMVLRKSENGPSPQEKAWEWFFNSYKNGAMKRQLNFQLSLVDFKFICQQQCHYCGLSPSPRNRYYSQPVKEETLQATTIIVNGIDRIDPKLGYIITNCVPCCTECNYIKRDHSVTQFLAWAKRIYNWQTRQ